MVKIEGVVLEGVVGEFIEVVCKERAGVVDHDFGVGVVGVGVPEFRVREGDGAEFQVEVSVADLAGDGVVEPVAGLVQEHVGQCRSSSVIMVAPSGVGRTW